MKSQPGNLYPLRHPARRPDEAVGGRPMRQSQPGLALVIPTLHEAGNLRPLLDRVRRALDPCCVPYEVIVVDDESEDGTEAIVSAIGAADERVRLIVRSGERGLAGAVTRGWADSSAPLLAVMDADL